jgi:hypothetical protein
MKKEIETVTEFNYLGVTLSKNGKYKLAKQKNIEKATKAMYEVIRRGISYNLACFASSEVLICRISNEFSQLHNYH